MSKVACTTSAWGAHSSEEETHFLDSVAVIPNHFLFVWFGPTLPTFAVIALRSALVHNPRSTATLYHDDDFVPCAQVLQLTRQGLRLRRIEVDSLLARSKALCSTLNVAALKEIYQRLRAPAARSNLIRLLVLFSQGGVYLDTDTLTLKDFGSLRKHEGFVGEERVLWPAGTHGFDVKAITLSEVRRICAVVPYAYRMNRKLRPYYSLAANNAVMGFRRAHPFVAHLLELLEEVPEHLILRRYMLGTHLLQKGLDSYRNIDKGGAVERLAPDFFYPLGPMISRHYFNQYGDVSSVTRELLTPDTHVIHWYASVSALNRRDPSFIARHARHEVFSSLCAPYTSSDLKTVGRPSWTGRGLRTVAAPRPVRRSPWPAPTLLPTKTDLRDVATPQTP